MTENDVLYDRRRHTHLHGNDLVHLGHLCGHRNPLPMMIHQQLAVKCLEGCLRLLNRNRHASSDDELAVCSIAELELDLSQNLRFCA
jgi:hypothetical protein